MEDILGKALLDYHKGNYTEDIMTETTISDEDVLPLPYLFRALNEMPLLEQTALKNCSGSVLDVGCGAGSHSLWLQNNGFKVKAIDISEGAVAVSKKRGVKEVFQINLLDVNEKYDTILLLMNGTGIFETIEKTPFFLNHLKNILHPKGQVLIDSSDLQYMYDKEDNGAIWVPQNRYYGELDFIIKYKKETSKPFPWLYLDAGRLRYYAENAGFKFKVLQKGNHYDYLAQLAL